MTTLDDFLAQNEEAFIAMSIADRILLARSLLDSVSAGLLGETIAPDESDDYDYECIEEEDEE